MTAPTPMRTTFDSAHQATYVAAWMSVAEGRAALAAAGQPALPVVGHDGLIGLITVEALGGADRTDHAHPMLETPLISVMDWHLVRVPADADDGEVLRLFTDAASLWLSTRADERTGPDGDPP